LSTDIELIIEACKNEQNPKRVKELMRLVKEWDAFIDLAYAHGVFPLVYKTLKNYAELIPQDILHSMKMSNMQIVKENMLMSAELIKVMKLLEQNGIKAIAFKGPTLAQLAYGDIALRQYSDLDILIQYKDIEKTTKILKNNFYTPIHILENYQQEKLEHVVHDMAFQNIKNNVLLECHWVLSSGEFHIDMTKWNDLHQPTFQTIQKTKISTLANEKLMVYLCVHGYKHMWERIEWLVDIIKLDLNSNINWHETLSLANDIQAKRILLSSLYLCDKLLNMQLSQDIKQEIDKDKKLKNISHLMLKKITKSYNTTTISTHSKHISIIQFYMLQTTRNRLLYILTLFQPTEQDYKIIKLPKYLSFLYYFIRPINILIK